MVGKMEGGKPAFIFDQPSRSREEPWQCVTVEISGTRAIDCPVAFHSRFNQYNIAPQLSDPTECGCDRLTVVLVRWHRPSPTATKAARLQALPTCVQCVQSHSTMPQISLAPSGSHCSFLPAREPEYSCPSLAKFRSRLSIALASPTSNQQQQRRKPQTGGECVGTRNANRSASCDHTDMLSLARYTQLCTHGESNTLWRLDSLSPVFSHHAKACSARSALHAR